MHTDPTGLIDHGLADYVTDYGNADIPERIARCDQVLAKLAELRPSTREGPNIEAEVLGPHWEYGIEISNTDTGAVDHRMAFGANTLTSEFTARLLAERETANEATVTVAVPVKRRIGEWVSA